MILRCVLLLVCLALVTGDTSVRQQRIVRRPQDFSGPPRPVQPSAAVRGGPTNSGPPRPNGPNIQQKPAAQPPTSHRPRGQLASASNKKPVFRPNRPKPQVPLRANDKSQPQVEYGFKPINVASNGYVSSETSTIEVQNPKPVQQKTVTTVEIEKPLVINVQPLPPVATSFQNHNQQDSRAPIQSTPKQHIQQSKQQAQKPTFETKSRGPQYTEQAQNQQSFEFNSKRNAEQLSNNQHNFPKFENENKNKQINNDHIPRGPSQFNTHKVPVEASISFQNQQGTVSQIPRFQQGPQPHSQRGQFQDSKIINAGAQFQVQESKQTGHFIQDKNTPPNFFQGPPQFPGNFGHDVRAGSQFIQGNKFNGQGFTNFNQEKSPGLNVQFQVQHPRVPQHFGQELKVVPQFSPPPQFTQPQFHHQQQQFPPNFNQDPKFLSNNQFILQDPKLGTSVPVAANLPIPHVQNQQLQAHYQIQDAYPLNLQQFPQFKIPPGQIHPQIFGQKNVVQNQDQISIPVGATFPFGVNPFLAKGVAQGQVFPVAHIAGSVPHFAPLPPSLQFAGQHAPAENVQQSLSKDKAEQEVSASQTLKLIAPAPETSAVSASKPKKTTLKDILAEDCSGAEEFGYCASPPRYPTQQVSTILKQCAQKLQDLYEPESTPAHHISERANNDPWSWSTYENTEGSDAATCESTAAIVEPGYARDSKGHWLVILQQQASNLHQQVTVDVCAHEGGSCGCIQQYENKNLIAWDPDHPSQCPTLKPFKFPTKCVCPGEKTEV